MLEQPRFAVWNSHSLLDAPSPLARLAGTRWRSLVDHKNRDFHYSSRLGAKTRQPDGRMKRFWNDGDDFILGRVERAKLKGLDASDWTYYAGGEGLNAEKWKFINSHSDTHITGA